jgi:hypothetical protein
MSVLGLIAAPSAAEIDRALAAAVCYLEGRQSPDGAWRSDIYGVFRGGDALTPLVLHALHECGGAEDSLRRGAEYLAGMARPDGTIDTGPWGLSYPAYTAALAVGVLAQPCHAEHHTAADTWLSFLRHRQLTESLGWTPADREYGGWGYSHRLPCKPPPGEPAAPLTESNLSATAFALAALRAAGCADEAALRPALVFVQRCQNYHDEAALHDPAFDDGGFFFMYDDAVRNKAGVAGKDRDGRPRYASYGSMTADGLCSLLACSLPRSHPRVRAALGWLEERWSAAAHPGRFAPGRAGVRASIWFYYCWSAAQAFSAAGGAVVWPEVLVGELLRQQRPDGSWCNAAVEVREDEPLVATSQAAAALALCRSALAGKQSPGGLVRRGLPPAAGPLP